MKKELMTRSGFIRRISLVVAFVLIAALLVWPAAIQADTAQYFYDELGRLVAVVDGQGRSAGGDQPRPYV